MGRMIWSAIRQSAIDIWDEMLYLMLFNVIWVVGTLLIIPWPFVTFALFAIVYDIGQGKGISFGQFFSYGRAMWKQAYTWGGINLGIFIVVWMNINFYINFDTQWSLALTFLILSVSFFWFVLQLMALAIYPRMEEPGFKVVTRNAAVLFGRYPVVVFTWLILMAVLVVVSFFLQVLILVGVFSLIAVLTNRMVEAMVRKELKRTAGEDEP
ncbi:MAG: hypothetical protein JW953_19515 [Anaerolineae bacterium]|nr:hypothetical protein [Anaerolineae bacterium]